MRADEAAEGSCELCVFHGVLRVRHWGGEATNGREQTRVRPKGAKPWRR